MAKSYFEKLKDPRWQKKRLEIMQRAEFGCEWCGVKSETLHVHHGYYERGKEPWDYDYDTLHCLCEGCHDLAGGLLAEAHQAIAKLKNAEMLCDLPALIELFEECWPYRLVPEHPGKTRFDKPDESKE
jgi:hypothetical protein